MIALGLTESARAVVEHVSGERDLGTHGARDGRMCWRIWMSFHGSVVDRAYLESWGKPVATWGQSRLQAETNIKSDHAW